MKFQSEKKSMNTIPNEVVQRFAHKHGVPLSEAHQLFKQLEGFLDKASICISTPSPIVDEAWHEFVLHTKYYSDFCMNRYGRFIHHVPTSPLNCEGECGTGFTVLSQNKNMSLAHCEGGDACSSDCASKCDSE